MLLQFVHLKAEHGHLHEDGPRGQALRAHPVADEEMRLVGAVLHALPLDDSVFERAAAPEPALRDQARCGFQRVQLHGHAFGRPSRGDVDGVQ